MDTHESRFDVIVVGGSYAGLSAATQLARARRRVLVIDAGQRRNRFAHASHGFLGRDGTPAADIAAEGRAQLLAYPTVQWREGLAGAAQAEEGGFGITINGVRVHGRRLVLATGVADQLPAIEGLAERWGKHVFHCPYCHGYELGAGPIGVLASGEMSLHHALMLPDWGQVSFFLNDSFTPDAEQRAALAARGVSIVEGAVARIDGEANVVLADGRQFPMAGLFTLTRTRMASGVASELGCAFEEGPLGASIRIEAVQKTSVPGVFACGDAARAFGNVAIAVADGAMAGVAAHQSLLFP